MQNIFTLRTPEDAANISALAKKGQKMIVPWQSKHLLQLKNIGWKLSTPTNTVLMESDGVDKQIECVRFDQFQSTPLQIDARMVVNSPYQDPSRH